MTAKGKLDGKDVSVSALVSVMESSLGVAPVFRVCGPGQDVTLTAEALTDVVPAWSLKNEALGGKLSTKTGHECVYTPGPASPDRDPLYIDTVLVKNPATNETSESLLLVLNTMINVPVIISEASDPHSGEVQLQIVGRSGPTNPPDNAICTLLESGGGTLSPTGVFKEPANASGFAVVSVVIPGDFSDNSGFIVLPLPLSTYADISQRVSRSMQQHARTVAHLLP